MKFSYDLIHINVFSLMHVNSTTHHSIMPHIKTWHLMPLPVLWHRELLRMAAPCSHSWKHTRLYVHILV